jgi:ParB-like chromosome segregation protein Spo0J
MTALYSLPIEQIRHRRDARNRSDDALSALADSIAEIGLLNPIRVRRMSDEEYEVVAGSHRLQAAELLGWREISAIVSDDDDLHAELAMIDENLMRAELSPSDRATQTARRKAIYEELHPETAHGVNQHSSSRQLGDSSERFTSDTAKVTGQSERKVQRDAERGEKVIATAIEIIRGTALDTGTYLDKLKRVEPGRQVETVRRDLAQSTARGGIGARYAPSSAPRPSPSATFMMFQKFMKLVDEIEAMDVAEIVAGALTSNADRAQLSTRATGLADLMDDIRGRLD